VAAACAATQEALDTSLRQAQRTADTQALVAPTLESAVAAVHLAMAAPQAQTKLLQYQSAASHFERCAADLQQQGLLPDAEPHRLLQTPLGPLSAEILEARCKQMGERATAQALQAAWQLQVEAQVAEVAQALDAARQAPDAQAAETRTTQAVSVLQACEDAAVLSAGSKGSKATQRFATPFGSLTAVALAQRCALEAHALRAQGPTLHWRTLAQPFLAQLVLLDRQLVAAAAQSQPAARAAATTAAIGGLQGCLQRSNVLRHTPGAEGNTEFETPWGIVTLRKLTALCRARLQAAQHALQAAQHALRAAQPASNADWPPLEPIPTGRRSRP
jgi:hypothetical protein